MIEDRRLLENLLLFGRLLRKNEIDVNPRQMIALLRAFDHIQITNKSDFYHTCRCILVHNKEHIRIFDHIFEEFWRDPTMRSIRFNIPSPLARPEAEDSLEDRSQPIPGKKLVEVSREQRIVAEPLRFKTYSAMEILRRKDFAQLDPEEVRMVKGMVRDLVLKIGSRRTRRWSFKGRTREELRKTLRRNMQYGGNILEWNRSDPKWKPRPLVVLADVSGSMERYTEMLLFFLLRLTASLKYVEAFVFSTRLTRITKHLKLRDIESSLSNISRRVPDWSGGTRIGAAIKVFNFQWSRRVLKHSAVVLLISDGWDRGEPELLARELARLQRSCHRLIWLNPLLGVPNYQPITRGIQAALPFVDDHLPVHNLESLERLESHLLDISQGKKIRPQRVFDRRMAYSS